MSDHVKSETVPQFGTVYCNRHSRGELEELFTEIDDYFDAGITLRAGDTVFDVGANIGAFAIVAAQRCEGDLDIHCFEPAPLSFSALVQNARGNPWLKRARHRLHCLALSSVEDAGGVGELHYFSRFPADSTMDLAQKRREFRQYWDHQVARSRSLLSGRLGDTFARLAGAWLSSPFASWLADRATGLETVACAQDAMSRVVARHAVRRIDLLKVDVEGFELRVLDGIDAATWDLIRQVVIETDGRPALTDALLATLRRAGFATPHVAPTKAAAGRGLSNVIVSAMRA